MCLANKSFKKVAYQNEKGHQSSNFCKACKIFNLFPSQDPGLYEGYHLTWVGLFHMTLGEYDYATFNDTPYPGMAKIIFVIFQIFIPILLFNMLIAMMGNTYASVNEKSEKEFLKMWAKIIMSFERSVPQNQAKEYLEKYSIRLTATERGVMVIKAKDKTRASQRKGALSNWKVHFIFFYKLSYARHYNPRLVYFLPKF